MFAFAGRINPAGALDTTFGTGGLAFATVGPSSVGNEVVIQADGKIIVAGYTEVGGGGQLDFAVARFHPNGTLDTSFDGDGKVQTPIGTSLDLAYTAAIQADGKIVVAGGTRGAVRDDFGVVRYNTDGSLDTSFDGDGKVVTSISVDNDFAQAMVIQPDGKIIVVGETEVQGHSFGVVRYNPDGSLDTSFDGDGKVTTSVRDTADYDLPYKVMLQPDGKIVVAGRSLANAQSDFDFALVRYNADGSLDPTFDGDGKLTTPVSPVASSDDGAFGIALQPDGKIVVAGNAYYSMNSGDCAVLRYNANGSLDTTFDGDGKAFISFGNLTEALLDVVIQPDGKIVTAGHKSNFTGPPIQGAAGASLGDLTVARLNPNGSLDTTFDGDGKVITEPPINGTMAAFSMKLLPNGKVIAAGYKRDTGATGTEFALARYMGDLNTADFDGDTKTDISIFRPSNGEWWMQNSSNNAVSAFTFGTSSDKITPGDFTGDGKTDIAVWRPSTGEWFVLRSDDFSYFSHPFGATGDNPAPADFDGDGKTDEAVFRPSTATWYVLRSSGGTTIQQFGANGDVPIAADYDGDGKADIAIFRPLGSFAGEWWIFKSSNSQVFSTHFGSQTDKPVPGDYTGDSKTDIAFWRPQTGFWFVLRSEDNSNFSIPFGTSDDVAAPGDYDGDGIYDAAVFRPSSSTWFVRRSTAGTLIQNFGISTDKPVPGAFVR